MSFICGSTGADAAMRILAKLAEPCCYGSIDGPAGCTCWTVEYDLEQAELGQPAIDAWPSMCDDCAFRPDSPERNGDDRYIEPPDGEPFWCHRGMRKVKGWRHPFGIYIEADGDYYAPLARSIEVDGHPVAVPFQADGQPAKRCAGWAAHARRDEPADFIGEEVTS